MLPSWNICGFSVGADFCRCVHIGLDLDHICGVFPPEKADPIGFDDLARPAQLRSISSLLS